MIFSARYLALATMIVALASGLPLDAPKPRNMIPRAKSYAVINVDGGSSTQAPPQVTSQVSTTTVEVTASGPTVTEEVTATVVESVIVSKSISHPIETPKPNVITIIVTKDDGPTQYYDNGMWHTNYEIKTFAEIVTTFATATSSPT